jgi:beta-glucosidase
MPEDAADRDVEGIVRELTRAEKLRLVRGARDPAGTATGYVPGVDRLDVPSLRLVDGPLGIRAEGERATAFPASIATAATFDPELAREQGAAMAREALAHDQDVLLAPGTNLIRVPHCGRNFEYYAEDPHLSGVMAAGFVEGVESAGVLATVKHYVANNQETARTSVSAAVDDRTLRELYLRPFRAAVDAGVGCVMTAYNRVNGVHMSDHADLVGGVLKGEWGFDGVVMSDWYGLESTVGAATAGLDLEMPGVPVAPDDVAVGDWDDDGTGESGGDPGRGDPDAADPLASFEWPDGIPDATHAGLFGDPLAAALDADEVPPERLDDMVRRVLGAYDRLGLLSGTRAERPAGELDTPAHRELAERVAARGTVLLENDGVLPLSGDADVAVIGPHVGEAKLGGGGSSETTPFHSVSPVAGFRDRADGRVTVARGIPEIASVSLFDLLPFVERPEEADGDGDGGADSGGGADVDGSGDRGAAGAGDAFDVDAAVEDAVDADEPSLEAATEAAAAADVAVVFVRDTTTEGRDRDSLRLPGRQDDLVEAVAAANERTVVVLRTGGPVEVPWRDDVAALVEAWYPGQADGRAVAATLYGDRDPSGRLPVTFAPEGTYPTADDRRFPGVDGVAHYEEGLFVGYRAFDADRTEGDPVYPFGHGESYATFAYGEASVTDSTVSVTVENVADRPGREVVQAYVRPPETGPGSTVERPVRELAGVTAVPLHAGESRTVDIDLDERALGRYDESAGWTIDPGVYAVEVGRSVADVRTTTTLER